jgi:DNA-directed RNA polymerase subunit RPC12/RpoP
MATIGRSGRGHRTASAPEPFGATPRDRARALATESAITPNVKYHCPRCHAALEARSSQVNGWIRCARCGRAGLPPESLRKPRTEVGRRHDARALEQSALRPAHVRRITGVSAMFMALLVALLALLEQSRLGASVFTLIALACLAFSIYPVPQRVA